MQTTDVWADCPVLVEDEDGRWSWTTDPPETETIDGLPVRKMSPKRRHARLQRALIEMIGAWPFAHEYEYLAEWIFRVSATNELIPDVSLVSLVRLAPLTDEEVEEPPFAPDIAIEIRSRNHRHGTLQTKIARYLDHGARLVLDVDPNARRIVAHTPAGTTAFEPGAIFDHAEMPGFRFALDDFFARGDRTPR